MGASSGTTRAVRRSVVIGVVLALAAVLAPPPAADAAAPPWLQRLHEARITAGMHPLTEREDWNQAARQHAFYSVHNQWFAHDEDPSLPHHTPEGKWAAETGNLAKATARMAPPRAIEGWLNSPGHGFWSLHWAITEVGYGEYHDPSQYWSWTAVLPIVGSFDWSAPFPGRYSYPGDGAVLRVPDPTGDWTDRGTTTLHLYRADLTAGTYTAEVRVNGTPRPIEQVTTGRTNHLAIVLRDRLPSGSTRVEVTVRRDGAVFDRWSFSTSRTEFRPPPGYPPLWDVIGTTHESSVRRIADADITQGFGDGTFRPGGTVTRGQMATFIAKGWGLAPSASDHGLTDIAGSAHAASIRAVAAAGITGGFPDGTFRPNEPVTRGQMATFLRRAMQVPEGGSASFTDVAGTTHERSILAMADRGVAQGFGDGSFRPGANVSRGQMASFLTRALGL